MSIPLSQASWQKIHPRCHTNREVQFFSHSWYDSLSLTIPRPPNQTVPHHPWLNVHVSTRFRPTYAVRAPASVGSVFRKVRLKCASEDRKKQTRPL